MNGYDEGYKSALLENLGGSKENMGSSKALEKLRKTKNIGKGKLFQRGFTEGYNKATALLKSTDKLGKESGDSKEGSKDTAEKVSKEKVASKERHKSPQKGSGKKRSREKAKKAHGKRISREGIKKGRSKELPKLPSKEGAKAPSKEKAKIRSKEEPLRAKEESKEPSKEAAIKPSKEKPSKQEIQRKGLLRGEPMSSSLKTAILMESSEGRNATAKTPGGTDPSLGDPLKRKDIVHIGPSGKRQFLIIMYRDQKTNEILISRSGDEDEDDDNGSKTSSSKLLQE
ncbi:unnamed protein product [Strongylus vulgaris]|uniref:Uncharacterized protein n=1 Tax=Strongylus vulgaris TaxID=40348 RepID=A0A3P7KGV8_STRVU|nr:unnamed protein product [Strongylus vulgaris]